MGINDSAIIYNSKIMCVKKKIDTLNSIGIKVDKYLLQLEKIDKEVNKQIENYNIEIIDKVYIRDLNNIYNNATAKLELLEGELNKYNSYVIGYNYCKHLDILLKDEHISETSLKEMVNRIIETINAINDTDTRDYNEEKEIVEKIYYTAYQVMKLEFIMFGQSAIFDTAKNNYVIESFISNEIEKDLESLKENNKITPLINETISRIKSNGLGYSYLDKILITSIALEQDNTIVNKIKVKLEKLLEEIKVNINEMDNIACDIEKYQTYIAEYKQNINSNNKHNIKEIFKRSIAALGAVGILCGCSTLSRNITGTKKYKTTKETFSTLNGYSTIEVYEGEKFDDYKEIILYEYEPYKEYNSKDYDYKREYTGYDITNIADNCQTLDDYLHLNLDSASKKFSDYNEKDAKEMTEEDLYEDKIIEVIKMTQDPDNLSFQIDKAQYFLSLTIFLTIADTIYFAFLRVALEKTISNKNNKEKINYYIKYIKNSLISFKKLIDHNNEVKEEFNRLLEKYSFLLQSNNSLGELKTSFDNITIEDPKIELDKRTKKLLKIKSKKDSK